MEMSIQKLKTEKSPKSNTKSKGIQGARIRLNYREGTKRVTTKGFKVYNYHFQCYANVRIFPTQWKVAQIILIPKPGKEPEEVKSYRLVSFLPILSKVFEKLILKRIKPVLESRSIISEHQFGFRKHHATIEQVHRIVRKIRNALERKCTALRWTQAFDKVWHPGLLCKIKKSLPHKFYHLFKSYLSNRFCLIKYQEEHSDLLPINSGVSQRNVLSSLLYFLFTAYLLTIEQTKIGTFADDTTILASHKNL